MLELLEVNCLENAFHPFLEELNLQRLYTLMVVHKVIVLGSSISA